MEFVFVHHGHAQIILDSFPFLCMYHIIQDDVIIIYNIDCCHNSYFLSGLVECFFLEHMDHTPYLDHPVQSAEWFHLQSVRFLLYYLTQPLAFLLVVSLIQNNFQCLPHDYQKRNILAQWFVTALLDLLLLEYLSYLHQSNHLLQL